MSKDDLLLVLALIIAAVFAGAAYRYGLERGKNSVPTPVNERVDTLYLRDTITAYKPVYIEIEGEVRVDTLLVRDSVQIPVPIERRVYADSNYRAVVSGWHPELEEISVYPVTQVITQVQTIEVERQRSRWGLGLSAGYGFSKGGLSPYVGIGVTFDILRF